MGTPSEQLAEKIIERLISEKLVSETDGKKMFVNLAAGTLKAEDWRLPIENAIEREKAK